MIPKILTAGLGIAALTATAALASGPDEFTLEPLGTTGSTVIYSPDAYTSGSTIVTDPAAPAGDGQFEKVNINDYLVPDTNTNSN